jgi:hypothetical protein
MAKGCQMPGRSKFNPENRFIVYYYHTVRWFLFALGRDRSWEGWMKSTAVAQFRFIANSLVV